jgi:hypothetical protein
MRPEKSMPPLIFAKLQDDAVPAAGELWIRPAGGDDRLRRAVARLVYERGLDVLERGTGTVTRIVVNAAGTQPTFDEMLAAWFAQELLQDWPLPAAFAHLAKYAELLRQGKVPTRLAVEETLEGIFLGLRNLAGQDLTDPVVGERFLQGWELLAARLTSAAKEGTDIFQTSLVGGGEFAEVKAYLLEDCRRYRRDVLQGEKWTVRLPGTAKPESGLFLRKPGSAHFPYWSRRDNQTPTGDSYVFLAVRWEASDWVFSVDPAHATVKLKDLAEVLQKHESATAARAAAGVVACWYDGRGHQYTIVSAPRPGGTRLSEKRVLAIVKKWARAKRFAPSWVPRLAAAAVLLAVGVFFFLWLRPGNSDPQPPLQISGTRLRWDLDLYPKVAQAVVQIKTPLEHGTGFLVSEDGWLVTNSHVIQTARPDIATGARKVLVNLAKSVKGHMQRSDETLVATVYKDDSKRDLALLRLLKKPGVAPLPIAGADGELEIRPLLDCLAIGNKWQPYRGDVRLVYDWPREDPFFADQLDRLTPQDKQAVAQTLAQLERKIIVSSCTLVPGDSGGPLLNQAGEVIGVSFAIPNPESKANPLAKFSYHVHLAELHKLLADRPSAPLPYALPELPGEWPRNVTWRYELGLYSPQGRHNGVIFLEAQDAQMPRAWWVDFCQSNDDYVTSDLKQRRTDPVRKGTWRYQFALHLGQAVPWPQQAVFPTAYYDTEDKGIIDLMVQAPAADARPDVLWRLREGHWLLEQPADRPLLSADWFATADLRRRFEPYLKKLEPHLTKESK